MADTTPAIADAPAATTPTPYRSTPIFDETTLPAALRQEHRTKPGVWGVIRMLAGEITLTFANGRSTERVTPGHPGLLYPDDPHWVTLFGPMRMQVDFYDQLPVLPGGDVPSAPSGQDKENAR